MGQIPHIGFELRQNSSGLEMVNEFTERMKFTIEEATGRHNAVL